MSERHIPVQQVHEAFNIPVLHEDYRYKESTKSHFEKELFREHRAKFLLNLAFSEIFDPEELEQIERLYNECL